MVLRALTLENFKGIREPVRVEFAPVTLLFGPNNAGKSTIVQALIYAREVFERNNTDAGRTQLGGDVIDLGGFDNLVHGHSRDLTIRMRFELDVSQTGLPDYSEWVRDSQLERMMDYKFPLSPELRTPNCSEVAKGLPRVWVEVEIGWSVSLNRSRVKAYRVGKGDSAYAVIDTSEDTERAFLSYFDFGSEPFTQILRVPRITIRIRPPVDRHVPSGGTRDKESPVESTPETGEIEEIDSWFLEIFKALINHDFIPSPDYEGHVPLSLKSALPEWGRSLDLDPKIWSPVG